METRCPCCGCTLSLDALIAHDDARDALLAAFTVGGEFGKSLVRYLALFRPAKRDLTMPRLAKLINELLPDIKSQRIKRNGQYFDAPPEAWIYAFNQAISARERLTLPFKNHHWLYEVITSYRPVVDVQSLDTNTMLSTVKTTGSKTLNAMSQLQAFVVGNRDES